MTISNDFIGNVIQSYALEYTIIIYSVAADGVKVCANLVTLKFSNENSRLIANSQVRRHLTETSDPSLGNTVMGGERLRYTREDLI